MTISKARTQLLKNSVLEEVQRSFGLALESLAPAPSLTGATTAYDEIDLTDIQASRTGDSAAFRRLVERHQQRIGQYVWRFTRDRQAWEELVQNVFVEAYLGLKSYRGTGDFSHWLRRIATRVGFRYWRERTRNRSLASLDQASETAMAPEKESLGLWELMQQLPPRDRLALTLLYVEEYSTKEAAELAGWSESMMKVQAFRARKKLKTLWDRIHEQA